MKNRINKYWRMFGAGVSFSVFGIGSMLLSLFFFTIVRIAPVSAAAKRRWITSSIKFNCKFFVALMRAFGLFHYRFTGTKNLPDGGHLVVANHPSLIDALFIVATTDNLCCVVKSELFDNPFTAYVVKTAGYIANQSGSVLEDAERALASGKNILLFPEGTRSTTTNSFDFKRGAANIALSANCPITPVVIEISPRILQKGDRWYDMPEHPAKVSVTVNAALHPSDLVDKDRPITIQARQLNRRLVDYYLARLGTNLDESELTLVGRGLEQSAG